MSKPKWELVEIKNGKGKKKMINMKTVDKYPVTKEIKEINEKIKTLRDIIGDFIERDINVKGVDLTDEIGKLGEKENELTDERDKIIDRRLNQTNKIRNSLEKVD